MARKMQKKVRDKINGGGLLPDFAWTEDEKEEIREALEDTDAWGRFIEETEEDGRWSADGTSAK